MDSKVDKVKVDERGHEEEELTPPKKNTRKRGVRQHPAVIDLMKVKSVTVAKEANKQFMDLQDTTPGDPLTGKKIRRISRMTQVATARGQAGCSSSRYNFE